MRRDRDQSAEERAKQERIEEFELEAASFLPMIAAQFAAGKNEEDFDTACGQAIRLLDVLIEQMDDAGWFD